MEHKTITLNKRYLEENIEKLMIERKWLTERINVMNAFRREECIERIALMDKRDNLDYVLNILDIQTFQYFYEERTRIEIE